MENTHAYEILLLTDQLVDCVAETGAHVRREDLPVVQDEEEPAPDDLPHANRPKALVQRSAALALRSPRP